MISEVTIKNFKCLRDVPIELERFTVFVGPNASGKSSILQALHMLCGTFQIPDHPIQLPHPIESELSVSKSRGAEGPVELLCKTGEMWYRYRTRSLSTAPGSAHIHQVKWTGDGAGFSSDPALNEWKQWLPGPGGKAPLSLSVLLRLEASKLVHSKPVQPPHPTPDPTVMAPDGTGLHSALASMALNDPDSWQALQADLRRIIPSIRRLRHTKTVKLQEPASLLFDTLGGDSLPANQVSEGTLLVLGLLTALHASGRPSFVLLDDLDRGLHPKAQRELISLLRGLLDATSDLQILATTHSPYMLDCMKPKEVRMTFLRDDGATVCAALASHPKFEQWKDEMTPGEMWSLFGEKWLVELGATA